MKPLPKESTIWFFFALKKLALLLALSHWKTGGDAQIPGAGRARGGSSLSGEVGVLMMNRTMLGEEWFSEVHLQG